MVSAVLQGLIGLVLIVLVRWAAQKREEKRKEPHPPGPPGLPLLGNLLDMPDSVAWMTYIHWGEKYSKLHVALQFELPKLMSMLQIQTSFASTYSAVTSSS
jgi:hypothetical protein